MPTVTLRDMEGQEVGNLALRDDFFGITPHETVMHQAVVTYLANQRQGTAQTLTRGDVAGGGRKPYRQKGTGRARQGTTRAPHFKHGGVVFGPHPRDYRKSITKKMRRLAIASAFSARVSDGDVVVVDNVRLEEISTKSMAAFLGAVGATEKVLVILEAQDPVIYKSTRNIPRVKLATAPNVTTYEVLWADKIVITREAVQRFPAGGGPEVEAEEPENLPAPAPAAAPPAPVEASAGAETTGEEEA